VLILYYIILLILYYIILLILYYITYIILYYIILYYITYIHRQTVRGSCETAVRRVAKTQRHIMDGPTEGAVAWKWNFAELNRRLNNH
jgi:hypothetical protein